ncbi:hypothetical protein V757_04535 [Pelistega indica]|uniref:CinA C-terminal domain-containing protein n=1 Tax=Pelistega indica TaxID=1414851 RepID=V8G8E8_9BURK|nr:CinA family protein [Pelistega indica]ETD72381.1 hypothetical protein V757_04535 [Pelistega indica]
MEHNVLSHLSLQVGDCLKRHNAILSVAESCTGGLLASTVIETAGSSQWFDRGFVTYTNQAKQDLLDVKSITLETFGAVSENTAAEMVRGVLTNIQSSSGYQTGRLDIAISVTGIAGPDGGSPAKPVGMVCFGIGILSNYQQLIRTTTQFFKGNRSAIRQQSVKFALEQVLAIDYDGLR